MQQRIEERSESPGIRTASSLRSMHQPRVYRSLHHPLVFQSSYHPLIFQTSPLSLFSLARSSPGRRSPQRASRGQDSERMACWTAAETAGAC